MMVHLKMIALSGIKSASYNLKYSLDEKEFYEYIIKSFDRVKVFL